MIDKIAYAINATGQGGQQGFGMFLPLILLGLIFGLLLMSIAKRKGGPRWLWFIAGFVPGFNFFGSIWLASLPDLLMKEKLDTIIKKLQEIKTSSQDTEKVPFTPMEEYWTCTCGEVNKMDVANCSVCGLKRDFLLK